MAIVYSAEIKKQKYLIGVVFVIVLVAIFIFMRGSFFQEQLSQEVISFPEKKIEIDFSVLDNSLLNQLQPFEAIAPLGTEAKIGRENPFLPY